MYVPRHVTWYLMHVHWTHSFSRWNVVWAIVVDAFSKSATCHQIKEVVFCALEKCTVYFSKYFALKEQYKCGYGNSRDESPWRQFAEFIPSKIWMTPSPGSRGVSLNRNHILQYINGQQTYATVVEIFRTFFSDFMDGPIAYRYKMHKLFHITL